MSDKAKGKGAGDKPGGAGPSVGCNAHGCKSDDKRFGFCNEHFGHFKFGLIKKDGSPVPDYDKKFKHYEKMLHKSKAA